jgi:hypothetical protein
MTDEKDKKFQVEEQILIDSEWIRNIIAGNQKAFEKLLWKFLITLKTDISGKRICRFVII